MSSTKPTDLVLVLVPRSSLTSTPRHHYHHSRPMLVEPDVQSLEQDLNLDSFATNMFENERRMAMSLEPHHQLGATSLPHGRGIQLGHAFTTQPTAAAGGRH